MFFSRPYKKKIKKGRHILVIMHMQEMVIGLRSVTKPLLVKRIASAYSIKNQMRRSRKLIFHKKILLMLRTELKSVRELSMIS